MGTLTRRFGPSLGLALLLICGPQDSTSASPPAAGGFAPSPGTILLTPDRITDERERSVDVERGLFFVPENRAVPDSRMIAIHFIRFPAREPRTPARPPVFYLPGGPGSDIDFALPWMFDAAERLRATREIIYVSQRRYPGQPGITPALEWSRGVAALDAPADAAESSERTRKAFERAVRYWHGRGVDLAGYDIMNITSDLDELRRALGHAQIVLRGCSFGSQWSFAYLRRFPETVERAFLSGVEPLDYAYDSPAWLWASMQRLAEQAAKNPDIAARLPEGGLMAALTTILERLEAEPARVRIAHPDTGEPVEVAVGADDLRRALPDHWLLMGDSPPENLAQWPRFILEMHAGDYRFLAANALHWRSEPAVRSLITNLIDNSLGISAARDRRLRTEGPARWLGDINAGYRATREVTPTPVVDDAFRGDLELTMPVLLVTGDLDWSTPIENAEHAARFLRDGHFVRVVNGTHCTENIPAELPGRLPQETARLFSFIDADFAENGARDFFAQFPETLTLPPIDFAPVTARSLYDEWRAQRD